MTYTFTIKVLCECCFVGLYVGPPFPWSELKKNRRYRCALCRAGCPPGSRSTCRLHYATPNPA